MREPFRPSHSPPTTVWELRDRVDRDIRTAIYTTNSVESLNRSLRKIIKIRGGFPNEEAALKLLFLALRQAAKKWTMPIHH